MDPLAELEATLDRFDTISAWALATPNMQVLALASIAKDLRRIANSLEAKS